MKVAVVGAGVMGLAGAWRLTQRGADVTVYEQFEVGHANGSSHGRSRIFRLAYGEPEWVELAREAYDGWRELEAESGERLLELRGLLEVVTDLEESSAATLDACGVDWERLDGAEAERRFPVRVPPPSFAVLQPQAGIVRADRALTVLAKLVDVRENTRIESIGDLDADVVVVTAGSWVNQLVEPPLDVKVTRETVCYFRLDDPRPVPALVSFKPEEHLHDMYSLADPVHGLKVGAHHAGVKVEPGGTGEPDGALVERITDWARRSWLLADPDPVAAETCLYTTTPDQRFVLERRGRVVVGSACSGHGFKFAPVVGQRLADLVDCTPEPD